MPIPEFDKAGYDRLEAIYKRLRAAYPDVSLSLGYVGNCGIGYDDRAWKFFTRVLIPYEQKPTYAHEQFSFGYATSETLGKLADAADAHLEHWIKNTVLPHAATHRYRTFRITDRNIRFRRREMESMGFSYGSDGQDSCEVVICGKTLEQVKTMLPGCEVTEVNY